MKISERIFNTIEDWRKAWGDTLKGWLTNILAFGFEVFFNVLGKAASPKLTPLIDRMEATGQVPSELQPLLDEMKNPKGEVAAMFANQAGGALIGGAIGKIIDAILLPLAYAINSVTKNVILNEAQLINLWLRGKLSPEKLAQYLHWLGREDADIEGLKELSQVRLDPMTIITAWRRDPVAYATLFQDLKDQGWSDDRLDVIKFATLYYPTPQELVMWQAREVFEPEMIARYGLDAELEGVKRDAFYKAGMSDEQITNFWRAHWEHASWIQVVEMLHRGLMTEEEVWDWFRVVEIPPFWRQKLIDMSWNIPTRVDVRRWWDMRTIDEAELREIYGRQGYHGKDLDNYVLWTKVYVAFPDLLARFKNGWIDEGEVRKQLTALGMPVTRVDEMIQTKVKPEKPAQVEDERKATATEIMKGVKKGVITWGEGIEMLGDLNYPPETAEFKLNVYLGVSEGSPEHYTEFKQMSQLYRKAIGLEAHVPPIELAEAEAALKEAEAALRQAEIENKTGSELVEYQKAKSDAAYRYRQLLVKWQEEKKA